jgi:hypothetical protein
MRESPWPKHDDLKLNGRPAPSSAAGAPRDRRGGSNEMANKLKPLPKFMSDAEAERFVEPRT